MPSVIEEPEALELAGRVIGIERRAHRIGERDLDVAVALLERHADARERAARADRADEAVDLAVEVVEDLRAGRLVVAAPVGDVVELVRPDRAAGLGLRRAPRRAGRNSGRSCWGWRRGPPGTSISSAPASRSMSFFSCDWVSGITMTDR